MKFKIAIEMELDLTGLNTEMVEAEPDRFCEEWVKALMEDSIQEIKKEGANLSILESLWTNNKEPHYERSYLIHWRGE